MPIIGFTGTRDGVTHQQLTRLLTLIRELKPSIVHHGACHGADRDFHLLTVWPLPPDQRPEVEMWPSNAEQEAWAHRNVRPGDEVHSIIAPLTRNRHIVNASEHLIACPRLHVEERRSGTWATIRYARSNPGRIIPIHIIWPDGTVKTENV